MMRQDIGLNDDSELLPADWPGDHVERPLLPGDLSQFAANRGVQKTDLKAFHPFQFDSKVNAGGGLIYFDETIKRDTLKTILGVMGVHYEMMDYAIFAACSANPARDEYLAQVRLVSHHAIECGFFIRKKLPLQPRSAFEILARFTESQCKKWNRTSLFGTRGGDGDSAKETLGFGFMVEDTEWRIYRVWSRSWLLLK